MTLHIFNPEHDIAVASGQTCFTAPHAARSLRRDLGFLPALWADEADAVMVDDVERASQAMRRAVGAVARRGMPATDFVTAGHLPQADGVEPWGWDAALRGQLLRAGADERLLPTPEQIETTRQLSHRRTSARLLPLLQGDGTVGEAFECTTEDEVRELLGRYGRVVLKAPWSSTGRGIRFLSAANLTPTTLNWLRNLLARQGSVMAEPYYEKLKDFALEFTCAPDGTTRCEGLSLFHTQNGAYTGNIVATERAKRDMLARYLPTALTDRVQAEICRLMPSVLGGRYVGPFGVDMMVVKTTAASAFALHPCVEVNLRRTMGHVALAVSRMVNPEADDEVMHVMRIVSDEHYELKIKRL